MNSAFASSNPNLQLSETLVAGLADAGLKVVCIAPGSRSTPLTLAFDAHHGIEKFIHLDERSGELFCVGDGPGQRPARGTGLHLGYCRGGVSCCGGRGEDGSRSTAVADGG